MWRWLPRRAAGLRVPVMTEVAVCCELAWACGQEDRSAWWYQGGTLSYISGPGTEVLSPWELLLAVA